MASTGKAGTTEVDAPVTGQLKPLSSLPDDFVPQHGEGFAIKPSEGKIYAPFTGTVRFTFTTKHVLGMESDNGLEALIHIGLGTVNLRGEGFNSYYADGQHVEKGQLLMDFDRELIQERGYDDTVIVLFTQPQRLLHIEDVTERSVKSGEEIMQVAVK